LTPSTENCLIENPARDARVTATRPAWLGTARRLAVDEAGQTVVEFAVVLVLFCLLIFGVTQFGQAMNVANDETHLAEMAARYAAVNYNPGSAGGQSFVAWVKAQGGSSFAKTGQICISFPNSTANVGDPVEIVAKSNAFSLQPLATLSSLAKGVGLTPQITIQGQAVMRLEAAPSVYVPGCA
jgi:Flp pilus assembly protein TadG